MISDNQNGIYLNVIWGQSCHSRVQTKVTDMEYTNWWHSHCDVSAVYEYCNNKNMIKDVTDIAKNWIGMNGWL